MSTLGLVDRDRHGEHTNSPASHDSANEDHSQIRSAALQYGTYQVDNGSNQDCFSAAETVHCEPTPNL
jgi:hypothetical protein